MSLLHRTDVYDGQGEDANRNHGGYGFVLALVCIGLFLVAASLIFTPVNIGDAIGSGISLVGP